MGQRINYFQQRGIQVKALTVPRSGGVGEVCAWLLRSEHEASDLFVFAHGTGNDAFYPQLSLFTHLLQMETAVAEKETKPSEQRKSAPDVIAEFEAAAKADPDLLY